MADSLVTVSLHVEGMSGASVAERVGLTRTGQSLGIVLPKLLQFLGGVTNVRNRKLGITVDEVTVGDTAYGNDPVTVVATCATYGSIANTDVTYFGGYLITWATSAAVDGEVTIGGDADTNVTNLADALTALAVAGKPLHGILTSATADLDDDTVTLVYASPGAAGEFMANYDQSGGYTFDVANLAAASARTRKGGWSLYR